MHTSSLSPPTKKSIETRKKDKIKKIKNKKKSLRAPSTLKAWNFLGSKKKKVDFWASSDLHEQLNRDELQAARTCRCLLRRCGLRKSLSPVTIVAVEFFLLLFLSLS